MLRINDTYEYKTLFSQDDVQAFANLTDDQNPLHIDNEYAKQAHFGAQVAQGGLIMCAYSKCINKYWPASKHAYFISQSITYYKPVFLNVEYLIKFECTDIDRARNIGTLEGIMYDMDGNKIVKVEAKMYDEESFSLPKM